MNFARRASPEFCFEYAFMLIDYAKLQNHPDIGLLSFRFSTKARNIPLLPVRHSSCPPAAGKLWVNGGQAADKRPRCRLRRRARKQIVAR
jgi:hypothetical protein